MNIEQAFREERKRLIEQKPTMSKKTWIDLWLDFLQRQAAYVRYKEVTS